MGKTPYAFWTVVRLDTVVGCLATNGTVLSSRDKLCFGPGIAEDLVLDTL